MTIIRTSQHNLKAGSSLYVRTTQLSGQQPLVQYSRPSLPSVLRLNFLQCTYVLLNKFTWPISARRSGYLCPEESQSIWPKCTPGKPVHKPILENHPLSHDHAGWEALTSFVHKHTKTEGLAKLTTVVCEVTCIDDLFVLWEGLN